MKRYEKPEIIEIQLLHCGCLLDSSTFEVEGSELDYGGPGNGDARSREWLWEED